MLKSCVFLIISKSITDGPCNYFQGGFDKDNEFAKFSSSSVFVQLGLRLALLSHNPATHAHLATKSLRVGVWCIAELQLSKI